MRRPSCRKSTSLERKSLSGAVRCYVDSVTDAAVFINVSGSIFRMERTGGVVPFAQGQQFNLRFEQITDAVRPGGPLGVR